MNRLDRLKYPNTKYSIDILGSLLYIYHVAKCSILKICINCNYELYTFINIREIYKAYDVIEVLVDDLLVSKNEYLLYKRVSKRVGIIY